jgi:peptidoglycan/LPS O-acetylase OafA/YrhL
VTTAPIARASRYAALDGLRGLAAAAIVVHHAWLFDHGDNRTHVITAFDSVVDELRLGVALFFVLSGFLVYRPFAAAALDGTRRPSLAVYTRRRVARILPAYWLVLAASFVLLAAIDHPGRATLGQLPIFLAFAQNQFAATHGHLDPPMWSLTVEVSFYALLPLVGLVASRLATRREAQLGLCAALAACGLAFCALASLEGWGTTVTDSLLTQIPVFACGMAVAVLAHRRTVTARTGRRLVLAALPLAIFGGWLEVAAFPSEGPLRTALCDFPAAVGFALVVYALVASPIRARALGSVPMRTLGTLSYGMYLWHFPLIYGLRAAGLWPSELLPAMALTLGGVIALAAISWYGLERPIVRWAHRTSARDAPPPEPDLSGPQSARTAHRAIPVAAAPRG